MKNAHLFVLFTTFSLIACGSNDNATDHTITQPNAALSPPTSAQSITVATTPSSVPSDEPNPTIAPSATPAPVPSAEPTPAPSATPTPQPTQATDIYVGTYAAVTLPLYHDACAGSCAPSYDNVEFHVTHDSAGYHAGQIDATIQANGALEWQLTHSGVISTCSDVLITEGGELQYAADGRLAMSYSTLTTGTCAGGVRSSCECTYIAYVPNAVNP